MYCIRHDLELLSDLTSNDDDIELVIVHMFRSDPSDKLVLRQTLVSFQLS